MAQQQQQSGNNDTMKWVVIIGGGLLFYDKIFGKSKEEKQSEAEQSKIEDAPQAKNPTLENYKVEKKAPKGYVYIRKNAARILSQSAKDIKASFGVFNDDETKIVNAMKRAVTKPEINLLSRLYSALYKRDLMYDLKDNLNSKELLPIYKYINSLPEYTKDVK